MYLYDYSRLKDIVNEIELVYSDENSGEVLHGIVVGIDHLDENTSFVYVASPYDKENDKVEGNIRYKDILVFDVYKNTTHGISRDFMLANYGKIAGRETK